MASLNDYIDVQVEPAEWSAAHTPIIFNGVPYGTSVTAVTDNSGFAEIEVNIALPIAYQVGQLVHIVDSNYEGFHIIKSITSTTEFVVETPYGGALSGTGLIIYLPVLQFDLYSGYITGETYDVELPYTKIATFKVEPNTKTLDYTWNVSGYLQSIFSIVPPTSGIDFNMFNRFRLVFDNEELETYQVANASIDNTEFDTIYANTGQPLNQYDTIIFNCGYTVQSFIIGDTIQNKVYLDGNEL